MVLIQKKVFLLTFEQSFTILLLSRSFAHLFVTVLHVKIVKMSRKENNPNLTNVITSPHTDSSSDSETEFDELLNNNRLINDIQDCLNLSISDDGFSKDYAQPEKMSKQFFKTRKNRQS